MLDPVSAFGVAAATLQFLEFSIKTVAVSKAVGTKGSTDDILQLDTIYAHLKDTSAQLTQLLKRPQPLGTSQVENELTRMAGLCHEECKSFLVTISDMKVKCTKRNGLRNFRQALRIVWNEKAIEAFETRLIRYQRELTLALVVQFSNTQSNMTLALQGLISDTELYASEQKAQMASVLQQLSALKNQDRSTSIGDLIRSLSLGSSLEQRIACGLQWASQAAVQRQFLAALHFDNLRSRHSRIEAAHEDTFKWLFSRKAQQKSKKRVQSRLLQWLCHEQDLFWVSGKPGSGKSTLMKYISDHRCTREALEQWARSKVEDGREEQSSASVVIAAFYFWSAGTMMQKSQQGLFQTLLYTIFSHAPGLIQKLSPERFQSLQAGEDQPPWTPDEISSTIKRAVAINDQNVQFCFFIDGVDEYHGDHAEIIRLLQDFSRSPNIKLCVSSRPWNIFEDCFGRTAANKIYVQDLTRADIGSYVRSTLRSHPAWQARQATRSDQQAIANEIIDRAQGVFLWVFLVVRSLLDGLTNGDTLYLLQRRIQRIPTDLRQFFKFILDSLDPIYDGHVAHSFLVTLDSTEELPLLLFSYLDDEFENDEYLYEMDYEGVPESLLEDRCSQMRRRLNGRCKGLLEVYEDPDTTSHLRLRVGFLHRTVRDFLMTDDIRADLESKVLPRHEVNTSTLRAAIAVLKGMPRDVSDATIVPIARQIFGAAMSSARRSEILCDEPNFRLLDELSRVVADRTLQSLIWGNTSGSTVDKFLSQTMKNGLMLYTTHQLEKRGTGRLDAVRLQIDTTKHPLLHAAMVELGTPDPWEADMYDIVSHLLKHGCDPNFVFNAETPFARFISNMATESFADSTLAATQMYANRLRILKMLLSYGANPNIREFGTLCPHWAHFLDRLCTASLTKSAAQHYLDVVDVLLTYKADPDIAGCDARSPWHLFLGSLQKNDVRALPHHQQKFLAYVCKAILKHNSGCELYISERVEDVLRSSFQRYLFEELQPLLDRAQSNQQVDFIEHTHSGEIDTEEEEIPDVTNDDDISQDSKPRTLGQKGLTSIWNVLSWPFQR